METKSIKSAHTNAVVTTIHSIISTSGTS